MTTYSEATDGHHYRPGYNPQFVRKVMARRAKEAAAKLAEAPSAERPDPRAIIQRTAVEHDVPVAAILGPGLAKHIIAARHSAIKAVASARPDLSTGQLGRLFNREISSIAHALGRKKRKPAREAR